MKILLRYLGLFSFFILSEATVAETRLIDAAQAGDLAAVQAALKAGAPVDEANAKGETALLKATQFDRVAVARLLMESGADVNRQDRIQDSPFLYASAEGRTEILREMLRHRPDVRIYNRYGGNGLIPAAEKGHLENVKLLLDHTDMEVDRVNRLGWTALLEAIVLTDGSRRFQDIVRVLIAHGADVGLADGSGVTPLAHARARGYREIEEILLAAGAKPS